MLSLVVSVVALGFIIFFHELGHFLAAKGCGVGVVEFSLGMGPRILSRVVGRTRYSLRIFPFGGSCMMAGEEIADTEEETRADAEVSGRTTEDQAETGVQEADGEDEMPCSGDLLPETKTAQPEEDAILIDGRSYAVSEMFQKKQAWKRFLIIAAGPLFNFVLAFLLSLLLTAQTGYDKPVIHAVEAGMPAAETGMEPGDTLLSIGGKRVLVYRDVQLWLLTHQQEMQEGKSLTLSWQTESGERKNAPLKPVYAEDTDSWRMGIVFSPEYLPVQSAGELLRYSAHNLGFCIDSTIASLRMLFTGQVHREDVMGPVRMVSVMDDTVGTAAQYGMRTAVLSLFDLMLLISASLGAMNLIPFPALDGGQLFFILIEMIFRRPVSPRFVTAVNMTGMMILLGLMFLILFNDLSFLIR